jgi:hypothetical protein
VSAIFIISHCAVVSSYHATLENHPDADRILTIGYFVLCAIHFISACLLQKAASRTYQEWKRLRRLLPENSDTAQVSKPPLPWPLLFAVLVPLYAGLDLSDNLLILQQIPIENAVKYIYGGLLGMLLLISVFNRTLGYLFFAENEIKRMTREEITHLH